MSKKSTAFQYKFMCQICRGRGIFNPLNAEWIDKHLTCVRERIANVFFYRKGGTVIMIDAGYHCERLEEKMGWLDLKSAQISDVLLTHLGTDRTGAVGADGDGPLRNATVYLGEIENRYLVGERRRRMFYRLDSLPRVRVPNEKVLLRDRQVFIIGGVQVECSLAPGHTWGHVVYLLDGHYLLTGDTIWLGADGSYSFLTSFMEDNRLAVYVLATFGARFRARGLRPPVITGHTGYSADLNFVFARRGLCCKASDKRYFNPAAPYDAYDESEDTGARTVIPP